MFKKYKYKIELSPQFLSIYHISKKTFFGWEYLTYCHSKEEAEKYIENLKKKPEVWYY